MFGRDLHRHINTVRITQGCRIEQRGYKYKQESKGIGWFRLQLSRKDGVHAKQAI